MDRVIGHIDFDYFYAQVEEVENPSFRDRPVVVCVFSGRTEDSGVVSTANYKAREFGVHSGMPNALAKKKLAGRDPVIIRMDHEKYEVVSDRIMESLGHMVDALEPTGIDEAFFDLTDSTEGDYHRAQKAGQKIKESIFDTEHLTCSVGLARSKAVAKLASDMAKPGGLKVVFPEETDVFLSPIPVSKLYGVGPKTFSALQDIGVATIGDLSKADPPELERKFGKKLGAYLLAAATGTDSDPVRSGLEPTQFSRIVTLKRNTRNPNEIFEQLEGGLEYVYEKVNSSSKSFRTISAIGILTDLSIRTKSKTFETQIDDLSTIKETTLDLFEELTRTASKDLRRAGVRVSGLADIEDQTSLSDFLRLR
jgi:DNA polymerase IV (archaeal DinB-like DNA polymerase)